MILLLSGVNAPEPFVHGSTETDRRPLTHTTIGNDVFKYKNKNKRKK